MQPFLKAEGDAWFQSSHESVVLRKVRIGGLVRLERVRVVGRQLRGIVGTRWIELESAIGRLCGSVHEPGVVVGRENARCHDAGSIHLTLHLNVWVRGMVGEIDGSCDGSLLLLTLLLDLSVSSSRR